MVAGSSIVHGITASPAACASATSSGVVRVPRIADLAVLRVSVDRRDGVRPERGGSGDEAATEVVDVDATKPWRRAGPADLQEVAIGEGDDRQARIDLSHAHERAPVEALDRHAIAQPRVTHLARDDLDELLARSRLLWSPGLDLRLDVEPDLVGPVAVDEREDLAEQRHAGARDHLPLSGMDAPRRSGVHGAVGWDAADELPESCASFAGGHRCVTSRPVIEARPSQREVHRGDTPACAPPA
jgi:hypothetical protein